MRGARGRRRSQFTRHGEARRLIANQILVSLYEAPDPLDRIQILSSLFVPEVYGMKSRKLAIEVLDDLVRGGAVVREDISLHRPGQLNLLFTQYSMPLLDKLCFDLDS